MKKMKKSLVLLGSFVVAVAIYFLNLKGEFYGDIHKSSSKSEGNSEWKKEKLGRISSNGEFKSTRSKLPDRVEGNFKSVLPHGYYVSARNMSDRRAEGSAVLFTPNGLVLACGEISLSDDNTSLFLIGDISQHYPDLEFVRVSYRAVMKLKLSDQSFKMTSQGFQKIPKEEA